MRSKRAERLGAAARTTRRRCRRASSSARAPGAGRRGRGTRARTSATRCRSRATRCRSRARIAARSRPAVVRADARAAAASCARLEDPVGVARRRARARPRRRARRRRRGTRRRRPRRRRRARRRRGRPIVNGSVAAGDSRRARAGRCAGSAGPRCAASARSCATTPSHSAVVVPSDGSSTRSGFAAAGAVPGANEPSRRGTVMRCGSVSASRAKRATARRRRCDRMPRRARRGRVARPRAAPWARISAARVAVERRAPAKSGRGIAPSGRRAATRSAQRRPLRVPLARPSRSSPAIAARATTCSRPGASTAAAVIGDGVDRVALVRHRRRSAAAGEAHLADLLRGRGAYVARDAAEGGDHRGRRRRDGEHGRALGVPRASGIGEPELVGERGADRHRRRALRPRHPLPRRCRRRRRTAPGSAAASIASIAERDRRRASRRQARPSVLASAWRASERPMRAAVAVRRRRATARRAPGRDEDAACRGERVARDEHERRVDDVLAGRAEVQPTAGSSPASSCARSAGTSATTGTPSRAAPSRERVARSSAVASSACGLRLERSRRAPGPTRPGRQRALDLDHRREHRVVVGAASGRPPADRGVPSRSSAPRCIRPRSRSRGTRSRPRPAGGCRTGRTAARPARRRACRARPGRRARSSGSLRVASASSPKYARVNRWCSTPRAKTVTSRYGAEPAAGRAGLDRRERVVPVAVDGRATEPGEAVLVALERRRVRSTAGPRHPRPRSRGWRRGSDRRRRRQDRPCSRIASGCHGARTSGPPA